MPKKQNAFLFLLIIAISFVFIATGCGGGGGGGAVVPTPEPDFDFTSVPSTPTVAEITPTILGTPELKAAVKLLTEEDNTNIASVTPIAVGSYTSEIIYTLDSGETFSYSTNEIMILDETAGGGSEVYPFRKITAISDDTNGVKVTTVQVPLDEIFEELELSYTQEVTTGDVDVASLAPGVTLRKAPFMTEESVKFSLDQTLYEGGGIKIESIGNLDMKLKFAFSLKVYQGELNYFYTALNASQTTTLGFRATGSWTDSKEKELGNIVNKRLKYTIPVPTPAGVPIPVPVWVDVKIPFVIGVEANLAGTAETKLVRTDSGKMGINYQQNDGQWHIINTYNKSLTYNPPSLQLGATLTGYAGPKLTTKVYSLAGPWVSFYGALKLTAAASANYPLGVEYKLNGGVKSSAGADLGVFKKVLSDNIPDLSVDIMDPDGLASWEVGNGPDLEELTPSTESFTVLTDGTYAIGDQIDVIATLDGIEKEITLGTWSAQNGEGTITGSGASQVYTAPSTAGTYTLTYRYAYANQYDTDPAVAKTCTVNVVVREPKTLTGLTLSPTSTTINYGGSYDLANVTATASYNDDTTSTVTPTWDINGGSGTSTGTLSGTTFTSTGDDTDNATAIMRATYTEGGQTFYEAFNINITPASVAKTLTSISLSTTTATIDDDETYNLGGVTVTANYSDSSTESVSGTWSGTGVSGTTFTPNGAATYSLTCTYNGETANLTITVNDTSGGSTAGTIVINNGEEKSLTLSAGQTQYYSFTISSMPSNGFLAGAGTTGDGSIGDCKVYISHGTPPTISVYDYVDDQPDDGGGFQIDNLNPYLQTGTYYMLIVADTDITNMIISAAWQ